MSHASRVNHAISKRQADNRVRHRNRSSGRLQETVTVRAKAAAAAVIADAIVIGMVAMAVCRAKHRRKASLWPEKPYRFLPRGKRRRAMNADKAIVTMATTEVSARSRIGKIATTAAIAIPLRAIVISDI